MTDKTKEEKSLETFVQQKIAKWHKLSEAEKKKKADQISVITICMEPGSGGCYVAEKVAQHLGFDFFNRNIVHKIAESAHISDSVVDSLEKERLAGVQDLISSIIKESYIHPSIYLNHLMKVIGTLGKHGHCVVVGRGANFIIPAKDRFAVRVIAPLEQRIENIAQKFSIPSDEAKRRVVVRENRRRAFIRQSFNADIREPLHYDLMLNTAQLSIDACVQAVVHALAQKNG